MTDAIAEAKKLLKQGIAVTVVCYEQLPILDFANVQYTRRKQCGTLLFDSGDGRKVTRRCKALAANYQSAGTWEVHTRSSGF